MSFTNGFHGVTMGAVAATGNQHHRGGVGVPLSGVDFMFYDGYLGDDVDTLAIMDKVLSTPGDTTQVCLVYGNRAEEDIMMREMDQMMEQLH